MTGRARAPRTISLTYLRTYSDNGQRKLYVEWSDGSRTECDAEKAVSNSLMQALLAHARRTGVPLTRERW